MINLVRETNPMPEQMPNVRNKNFDEVALGYTEDMAIREAMRCLKCRTKPCVSACPVSIRIPDFVGKVSEGDFEGAYEIIRASSSLPAVCGRVCPQENQCQGSCVHAKRGESVSIGRLERFVADWHRAHVSNKIEPVKSNGHKVAIIGAGPAGLACAGDLVALGYEVTVYEALHKTGGVLVYGIPEFRLPKSIVQKEIDSLSEQGVKFVTNAVVGRAFTVDELIDEEGFEAVFIGTGAGLPSFMNIPGENLIGVCSANEYLTRINLMKAYLPEYDTPMIKADKIAVVGGGNVAMDASRCAKRTGASHVYVIYRRGMRELPARLEEVHHAMEEGVEFKFLTNPTEIIGDETGKVTGIKCVEMELGEPDSSGRRKPIVKPDSEFIIPIDVVVMSLGTKLNTLILNTTRDLAANEKGGIYSDEEAKTNRPEIFAGGDAVTGAATVIRAMGAGKNAASSIHQYLTNK